MDWTKLLSEKTQIKKALGSPYWEAYSINIFELDYQSIISSAAFRRLQDKTQVFPLDKSDFVRTRLTHSVEVSTIAKQLGIMATQNTAGRVPGNFENNSQIEENIPSVLSCAGLLHDLGNPPFGHFGEEVIRDWFYNAIEGGKLVYKGKAVKSFLTRRMLEDLYHFEGNAQALRILSKVRNNPKGADANLTYSVMSTLIKYPTDSVHIDKGKDADIKLHKMGYFLAEEPLFENICIESGTKMQNGSYARHPLTFLLEAADDIAYATSDLEDGLKKGLFTVEQFCIFFKNKMSGIAIESKKNKSTELIDKLDELIQQSDHSRESDFVAFQKWMMYVRKWLMYVVVYSFHKNYSQIMAGTYKKDLFAEGFHQYSMEILKAAMKEYVFNDPEILKLELAAKKILTTLLDDFVDAVMYWDAEDEEYKMTKAQKKLIDLISENYRNDYLNASPDKKEEEKLYLRFLMVTDFISGMTDSYAKNLYQELVGLD